MTRKSLLSGLFLIAAVLAAGHWARIDVLCVRAVREAGPVLLVQAERGDTFILSYTHSLERSTARDFFRIDESGRLILYGTEFRSSNAGLPSMLAAGETLTRENGAFRISGMRRVMDEISLWTGEAYGNTLTIHGVNHDLPSLAGETLLGIRTGTVTAAGYFFFKMKHLAAPHDKGEGGGKGG